MLTDGDRALVLRAIADPRVASPDGLWAVVLQWKACAARLREVAAQRYLAAPDAKEGRKWIADLRRLPPGSFASPLPVERAILADPARSRHAHALIARQADRGAVALPDLFRLLKEHGTIEPGERERGDEVDATLSVARAFGQLGPAAEAARGELERLLPILPRVGYREGYTREDWDVTLVAMGKPVADLTPPPDTKNIDRYRERVTELAAKLVDPNRERD